MNNIFLKNIFKEIRHSLGRFFSIMGIVAIGVSFFAGIKASAPDMKYSADQYFDTYNLQDIQVYSTLGFTQDEIDALNTIKGVQIAQGLFSMDTLTYKNSSQLVVKIFSLPKKQQVNQIRLVGGRMPKQDNECLIEASTATNALFGTFHIGDTIDLHNGTKEALKTTLKNTSYKIVGTCYTPTYLSYQKGTSNIGSGSVDTFIYVPDTNIKTNLFTEADIQVKNAKSLNTYSDAYFDTIQPVKKRIEKQANASIQERIQENQAKINKAKTTLKNKVSENQQKIDGGYEKLQKASNEITNQEAQLAQAKTQLDSGWQTYNKNIQVLDSLPAIEQGIAQLEQQEANLENLQQQLAECNQKIQTFQPIYDWGMDHYDTLVQIQENLQKELEQKPNDSELLQQLDAIQKAFAFLQNYEQMLQGKIQLESGIQQIQQALQAKPKLIEQRNQLNVAKEQLNQAYQTLTNSQNEYEQGLVQLQNAKQTLQTKQEELDQAKETLYQEKEKNEATIIQSQKNLDTLKKEWIVLDRNSQYSYRDYGACADRMDGIASVFPVFFFMVAALVCMTTMTRMVDEQRNEIGTLKALGYSKLKIASKYLIYCLFASVLGSIIGCSLGMFIFPSVIFKAWNTLYNLEQIHFEFQPQLILLSTLSVTCVTLLATFVSIYKELIEVPSQLMRPKAAKAGKKILLEKLPWIWKRFSFLQKVSLRNLFRYKKRFFMTIIGICGCSALLVAGFGINDSISDIARQQYKEIYHYDASMTSEVANDNMHESLLSLKGVQHVYLEDHISVTMKIKNKETNVSVHIIDDPKTLSKYTSLHTTQDKNIPLKEDTILISQKMANELGIQVQDTLSFNDSNNNPINAKVGGIFENYVGHHIYVSRALYNTWDTTASLTHSYLIQTSNHGETFENHLGKQIMKLDAAKSITFYSSLQKNFQDMIQSISIIVVVLVISAAALAFVVLYNLSNVNISERIREIATIKVLGFTTKEVSAYVNRESILLTIIGAFIGLFVGVGLHHLIMNLAEMDDIMFGRTINPISFVVSFVLTIIFSIIVNLIMLPKLKKIQMVESLKAVE